MPSLQFLNDDGEPVFRKALNVEKGEALIVIYHKSGAVTSSTLNEDTYEEALEALAEKFQRDKANA